MTIHPYDPQPKEPARAYQAFTVYRDLGPTRTLQRAASEIAGQSVRRSSAEIKSVERWSTRWAWPERCQAWDMEVDRQRRRRLKAEHDRVMDEVARAADAIRQTLTLPTRAMLTRLTEDPQRTLDELANELTIAQLVALQAACARVMPGIVELQLSALGGAHVDDGDRPVVIVDRLAEEERLKEVAEIMQRYKLLEEAR